jgi:hypothetical protein
MSEFKVGDRVRMIACKRYAKIIEAKVICSKQHYLISFEDDASECLFPEIDLEIVDEHGKTLLEQRIEKLEKCANVSSMSKNGLLTEDERVILRNLDKNWKWIARDKCGMLVCYENKPEKLECSWWDRFAPYETITPFEHLFKFIKWEDDKPYNIEELLKEGNDE